MDPGLVGARVDEVISAAAPPVPVQTPPMLPGQHTVPVATCVTVPGHPEGAPDEPVVPTVGPEPALVGKHRKARACSIVATGGDPDKDDEDDEGQQQKRAVIGYLRWSPSRVAE